MNNATKPAVNEETKPVVKLAFTFTCALVATIITTMALYLVVASQFMSESGAFLHFAMFVAIALMMSAYFLIGGLIMNGPLEKSVPEFLGSFTSWEAPPGLSWWFPPGLGSRGTVVQIDQKTLDRTSGSKKMIVKVLTRDDIPVDVGVVVQYVAGENPGDATKYAMIDDAEKAFEAMIEGNVRVYLRYFSAAQAPDEKHELADFLMGKSVTFRAPNAGNLAPSPDKKTDTNWHDENVKDGSDSDARAREMGITIKAVSVAEINQPDEIAAAKKKEEIEKAERRAENVQIEAVGEQMQALKTRFPGLSDIQILHAVQAERGKIRHVVVEGNAGDFTKGAVAGAST